jgi:amino acid transporter
MKLDEKEKSFLKKIVPIAAFIAGLCCFAPVVLVLFGISTVAFAASLSDLLYGTYKWAFRGAALLFLGLALFWYLYKKEKVCTIDELKKKRRKIINLVLLTLITAIVAYIIWLYVIVEIIGILLGIWSL